MYGAFEMSQELKPCPFCGGEALLKDDSEDCAAPTFTVQCQGDCYFAISEDSDGVASAAWNRRHTSERDRLRDAVVKAALEDKCPRAHSANLTYALAALSAHEESKKEKL